jgi:hypothetical protein
VGQNHSFRSSDNAYYQRRRGNGDTRAEALRALRPHVARIIFKLLDRPPLPHSHTSDLT